MKKPVDTHALISAAAKKHRVPAAFVKSIVAAESNFNCDAISPKGAIGLMQLMPQTAEEYVPIREYRNRMSMPEPATRVC